ncbi:MAG: recombinase family protein [Acidobacteria bacterium]|nr:recombinase family protein [Acidobacteriota bacterium]
MRSPNTSENKVGFVSLQENIDTTTSGGKLIFHVFGALAEFERELIRERTMAGLASARAMTEKQIKMARAMLADPNNQIQAICETHGVSNRRFTGTANDQAASHTGQPLRPFFQ